MRFPALDGIRALAATMVFVFHYGGGEHGGRLLAALNLLRLQGWAGVNVFFTLSGFLITGVLYDTRADSKFFSRFYARRSLRIFPVYYLVAALLLVLTTVFLYQWRWLQLTFWVYLGNIPGGFDPGLYQLRALRPEANVYLGHLWSLCVEEQFYLLWPLLVWAVGERVKLLWTAAGISSFALALRIWLVYGTSINLRSGWLLKMLPFEMDSLLIGALLALLLRGRYAADWQLRSKWVLAAALAMLAIGLSFDPRGEGRWMATAGHTLVALASAGLIGWALAAKTAAYKIFNLPFLRVLGRYSYGFYVYHLLFAAGWAATVAWLTLRFHAPVWAGALTMMVNFVVTFIVAKISFDFYEVRLLRSKRAFRYDSEG